VVLGGVRMMALIQHLGGGRGAQQQQTSRALKAQQGGGTEPEWHTPPAGQCETGCRGLSCLAPPGAPASMHQPHSRLITQPHLSCTGQGLAAGLLAHQGLCLNHQHGQLPQLLFPAVCGQWLVPTEPEGRSAGKEANRQSLCVCGGVQPWPQGQQAEPACVELCVQGGPRPVRVQRG
jgi:hypothetical protein